MIEYRKATKSDKEEIIDLINYVFSHDHMPHDFKNLFPKAYADDVDGLGAEHYIAIEDGKIKAAVAMRVVDACYYGKTLKLGLVGSVSVHPYSRGKGYMKKLVGMVLSDAKEIGVQLLVLSGQRQRYAYFGFENAGIVFNFNISPSNIRHALADVDVSKISFREMTKNNADELKIACQMHNDKPCHILRAENEFLHIMNSWSKKSYAIFENGEMIGYFYGTFDELVLKDASYYPAVVKAILSGMSEANIPAASYEREKIEFLSALCEEYSIVHNEKISVLDWKAVISAFLELKSKITVLTDGEKAFCIDGECFLISVKDNKVSVTDTVSDDSTETLTHNQAERIFFELDSFLNSGRYGNWFPLPFYIDKADTF